MKDVILVAPVFSLSGYGVHSRQLARYLLNRNDIKLRIAPLNWGNTSWDLSSDGDTFDSELNKKMLNCMASEKNQPEKGYDVSFQLQLPNEWNTTVARYNVGLTAAVETNICNPSWIKSVNNMNLMIVPSTFTKSVFSNTVSYINTHNVKVDPGANSLTTPIAVVHESFHDSILTDQSIDIPVETEFNFLSVGQLTGKLHNTDRKNTFHMLKWFCEEFKDDKTVGLILKTNSGRNTKIDRLMTKNLMNDVLNSVRKGPYPHVYMLHGDMTNEEMTGMYKHKTVKAFLSCTHGEGFGLPLLEAAAAGVPIIATDWSGHLDFLNYGKFVRLDYELTQIPKARVDKNIFIADSRWASVNENDVKRKLRKFYERNSIPVTWADSLKSIVRDKFSFDSISKQYDKELKNVL